MALKDIKTWHLLTINKDPNPSLDKQKQKNLQLSDFIFHFFISHKLHSAKTQCLFFLGNSKKPRRMREVAVIFIDKGKMNY